MIVVLYWYVQNVIAIINPQKVLIHEQLELMNACFILHLTGFTQIDLLKSINTEIYTRQYLKNIIILSHVAPE